MRTVMRRKNRAMKTPGEMEDLLGKMRVGRLAMSTEEGPYAVAVNYIFWEGRIYFHSALEGRKIEALRADPRVCFEVDDIGPQVLWDQGCGISQIYRSVICFGKAEFVEGAAEKRRILEAMVREFVPARCSARPLREENVDRTAVIRIDIESMSGKANAFSPSLHTLITRDCG